MMQFRLPIEKRIERSYLFLYEVRRAMGYSRTWGLLTIDDEV